MGTSQAGGEVHCPCGEALEIPRLRDLRSLPTAEDATGSTPAGWSFRLGVLSAAIMMAMALAAGAVGLAATDPEPPPPFDGDIQIRAVAGQLEKMPPAVLFRMLAGVYEPLARNGITPKENPARQAVEQYLSQSHGYQRSLWIAAGAFLTLGIGGFVVLPK